MNWLHISEVSTLSLYENPSLSITLRVIKDDLEESWLHLRKSSIPNSGFGVFAARSFRKNEFITCYLGDLTDDSEGSYVFKKINGLSLSTGNVDNYGNCWNCLGKPLLVSDHWFAHRIQHGSGGKVNVKISERYVITSLRKITVGEELFMDYNRDCKCIKYGVWCKYSFHIIPVLFLTKSIKRTNNYKYLSYIYHTLDNGVFSLAISSGQKFDKGLI